MNPTIHQYNEVVTYEKKQWHAITILKCIAAMLITNAHIGPFYPSGYDWLSFGGALGNSLFFFASGFVLVNSIMRQSFLPWYRKRLFRIYPTIWFLLLVSLLIGYRQFNILDFVITPYWFINAIIVFYFLFYLSVKRFGKKVPIVIFCLFVGMVVEFFCINHNGWIMEENTNSVYLHYWYYLAIMFIGAWVSTLHEKLMLLKNRFTVLVTISSFVMYMGLKFYLLHTHKPLFELQLLLPVLLALFALSAFLVCDSLVKFLLNTKIFNVISMISTLTLEIYLVQFMLAHYLVSFGFPVGILILLPSIVLTAYIIHKLFSRLNNLQLFN